MFTVYSKKSCPFCDKAKEALSQCGFEYEVCDIEESQEARDFFEHHNFKTVPQVYDEYNYIGGYEDLADYLLELI